MCFPSTGSIKWFCSHYYREVLRLRGSISREMAWEVMPDLFFYRDPEDAEKEEQERQKALLDAAAAGQSKQVEAVSLPLPYSLLFLVVLPR